MKKKDIFTPGMFRRLLVPSLVSSVGLAFANMADAVVVGRRMGTVGLAAISLCLPFYMILNVFMHGLGIGGSARYARLLGEGKPKEAVDCFNRIMRTGVLLGLILAVTVNLFVDRFLRCLGAASADPAVYAASRSYLGIIACGAPLFFISYQLQYFLCSDGSERLAGAGFVLGSAVGILASLLFVLCFDLGIKGAAWAALLGIAVPTICYLPGILHHKSGEKKVLRLSLPPICAGEVVSCFQTGAATSSQYVFQMVFLLIANNVLIRMAGEEGVAVFDIVQNASYLILYLYEGTAKAMQPLLCTFHGERNEKAADRTLMLGCRSGFVAGGFMAVLVAAFPDAICRLFGMESAALIALGSWALRLFCLSSVFAGIGMLLETYYQSVEEERSAFALACLRGWVVLLPCTVLFSFTSLRYFFWLYPVCESISLSVFLLWRNRMRKGVADFDHNRVFSATIQGENEDITGLAEEVGNFCEQWNGQPRQTYFVMMAVEEICMAIAAGNRRKDGSVALQITLIALPQGDFELHFRDNTELFDPFSLHSARAGEQSGFDMDALGVTIVKQQAKDYFYWNYQGFNSLVVRI